MVITDDNVKLRDMIESDIDDYVLWFTKELDWQDTDAPWEKEEPNTAIEERNSWSEYFEYTKTILDNELKWKFEIEYDSIHIGWVSSYLIDDNYEYISYDSVKDNQIIFRAIGIDICNNNYRNKGIGKKALKLFIDYYFDLGINKIYTQTWSGNIAMVNLAKSLGFKEINRKKDYRIVGGNKYDALTFLIEKDN